MQDKRVIPLSKLPLVLALGLTCNLAAVAAERDVGGQSSKPEIVVPGPAKGSSGHPGAGEPGIGLTSSSAPSIISLSSISRGFTARGATAQGYPRYGLENFEHKGRGPNLQHLALDWVKVDYDGAAPLWFGLNHDKNQQLTGAFYVGDRSDRVLPAMDTRYGVDAIIRVADHVRANTNAPAVQYVSGEVQLNAVDNTLTTPVALRGEHGSFSLAVQASQSGDFSGDGWYSTDPTAPIRTGINSSVTGEFFGGGAARSAIAGIANGDAHYQAAFGGVAQ